MWELDHEEGWALKNWCFLIVVLEKTLENPSDSREIQPVILNDPTSPECSLKGQMLKLKLHYFGHLMRRINSLEKTLMLGKIKGKRKTGRQRMRQLDSITDAMDINLSKLQDSEGQGSLACYSPWGHKESDTTVIEQQQEQQKMRVLGSVWYSKSWNPPCLLPN